MENLTRVQRKKQGGRVGAKEDRKRDRKTGKKEELRW